MVLVLVSLLVANIAALLLKLNCWVAVGSGAGLVLYVFYYYWHSFKHFYLTFPRDIKAGYILLRAKLFLWDCKKHNKSVPKVFKEIALKHPNRVMF
ncbi:unnamed protein product, partial [Medioppia subpectinata]